MLYFRNKAYLCSVKQYGLIGRKLSHSWSQQWFESMFQREDIADARYCLYEMDSVEDLHRWAVENHICGFNVTIPYKQAVIPQLDGIDSVAEAVGAVNCVAVANGRLVGHNTDAPAFLETLQPLLQSHHRAALVLGTGGAAKAVSYALRQLGTEYLLVSRTPQQHPHTVSYDDAADLAASHLLIINTTPVGMYPDVDGTPWPSPHLLGAKHLCYDLIYNPETTRFLREAAAAGARTYGGLAMLQRQAQLSWETWKS